MNNPMIQAEQIWRKNQPTQTQRIQIFGKAIVPDLKENVQSLDDQISDYTEKVKLKTLMLESTGILSLEDLGNQNLTDPPAFVFLKRNKKGVEFGKDVIEILFGSEIDKLKREKNRVQHAIDVTEWKPSSVRYSSNLTASDVEMARSFPLEELVGAYIKLRKSGSKTISGCCPFHDDRKPSFVIYNDSNRFICFGCGEKGDAISFLMKIKALKFKTAVRTLIALSGSEVKTDSL